MNIKGGGESDFYVFKNQSTHIKAYYCLKRNTLIISFYAHKTFNVNLHD